MTGAGVCRDYSHLTIALLRALDTPARLVAVYAPGCDPMDFHAVTEVAVDGRWLAVDATTLAPRQSLLRIATGRDAADTAFLTNFGGHLLLESTRGHRRRRRRPAGRRHHHRRRTRLSRLRRGGPGIHGT